MTSLAILVDQDRYQKSECLNAGRDLTDLACGVDAGIAFVRSQFRNGNEFNEHNAPSGRIGQDWAADMRIIARTDGSSHAGHLVRLPARAKHLPGPI